MEKGRRNQGGVGVPRVKGCGFCTFPHEAFRRKQPRVRPRAEVGTRVKPRLGVHRRLVQFLLDDVELRKGE